MERRCAIEAKDFFFFFFFYLAKFGILELRLEEKRKYFLGVVVLGSLCSA
jgi:hypothetical protein